jgi:PAS domain S-box-containing protein
MKNTDPLSGDILIVDDNINNLKTLEELLRSSGYKVRCASNGRTALILISARVPELILCDVRMPEIDGYELARRIKVIPNCQDIPIIFLSAAGELEEKLKGFAAGGVDYIIKPFEINEVQVRIQTHLKLYKLQKELERVQIETEEKVTLRTAEVENALSALKISQRKLALHLNNTVIGVIEWNKDLKVEYWNPAAEKIFGYTKDEALGKSAFELIVPENITDEVSEVWKNLLSKKESFFYTNENRTSSGRIITCEWTNTPLVNDAGEVTGIMSMANDITSKMRSEDDKQKLQEQLAQAQKMESIGQLAGGIAHDFNNMLSGIMSAADLLHNRNLSYEDQTYFLDLIMSASTRAADLTGKLLAFARKGSKVRKAVDLTKVVTDTIAILKRTIDKKISIIFESNAAETTVMADESIIQNVFMNMGINAGHAMPDGGILSFLLKNRFLDEQYCRLSAYDVKPGNYLELTIRDTGCGMPPEIMKRIFEPFFTTKEPGKGTGLGLAEAYGTIQDHHGAIDVSSKVSEGTEFRIYLPVAENPFLSEKPTEPEVIFGTGTIMLVDDEEVVRNSLEKLLKRLGYAVFTACDGVQAVELFKKMHASIDMVILDMIMPGMNGQEAFKNFRSIEPDIPVILSSGFSREEYVIDMLKNGLAGYVRKPFRLTELSQLVAKVIKNVKPKISNSSYESH